MFVSIAIVVGLLAAMVAGLPAHTVLIAGLTGALYAAIAAHIIERKGFDRRVGYALGLLLGLLGIAIALCLQPASKAKPSAPRRDETLGLPARVQGWA